MTQAIKKILLLCGLTLALTSFAQAGQDETCHLNANNSIPGVCGLSKALSSGQTIPYTVDSPVKMKLSVVNIGSSMTTGSHELRVTFPSCASVSVNGQSSGAIVDKILKPFVDAPSDSIVGIRADMSHCKGPQNVTVTQAGGNFGFKSSLLS